MRPRGAGLGALAEREVLRVLRLWTQTIAPPVVAATLFIVVFGVALGDQIRLIDGVPYERFIVPGLVLMGVATLGVRKQRHLDLPGAQRRLHRGPRQQPDERHAPPGRLHEPAAWCGA